jgi:hypothetical protein
MIESLSEMNETQLVGLRDIVDDSKKHFEHTHE